MLLPVLTCKLMTIMVVFRPIFSSASIRCRQFPRAAAIVPVVEGVSIPPRPQHPVVLVLPAPHQNSCGCSAPFVAQLLVLCRHSMASQRARCPSCSQAAFAACLRFCIRPTPRVRAQSSTQQRECFAKAHASSCADFGFEFAVSRAVELLKSSCAPLPSDFFMQDCSDSTAMLMARALVAGSRCKLLHPVMLFVSSQRGYACAGFENRPFCFLIASAMAPC